MANIQEQRSEATKRSILSAAGTLFAQKGFEAVTMREIAKLAKCSHTTIYIYFKDKESLLYELSTPPLQQLKEDMERSLASSGLSPDDKLKLLSQQMIRFCLGHRNMYSIFFGVKAGRVDETEPPLQINQLRNSLFRLLMDALQQCLGFEPDDVRLLNCSRIYYFTLYGIIGTYAFSEEPLEALMDRLSGTFDDAVGVLLAGFRSTIF